MYWAPPHNEQAEWGGATYPPQSPSMSLIGDYPQQTLIGWQGPDGNQPSSINPSSQVLFLALYSNNLFNPTLRGPLVPNFSLPEVHFSQNSNTYIQPPNTFPCAQTFCPDVPPHFSHNFPINSPSWPKTHTWPAMAPPAPFSPLPFHNVTSFPIPVFNPLSIQLPYSAHTSSFIPPPFIAPYVSSMPHQSVINTLSHTPLPPLTALHNPPLQYVYCLPVPLAPFSPTSHSSSHTPSKTLPSVSHISLLNSKSNFHT